MKFMNFATVKLILILFAFLMTACSNTEPGNRRPSFSYDLWGVWVSSDPSVYSGMLVIDFDRITISGYFESQTPHQGDDTRRPFRFFTKNVPLTGYSQDGYFFIMDAGELQEGIPYIYHSQNFGQHRILRLTFGDRVEILHREAN